MKILISVSGNILSDIDNLIEKIRKHARTKLIGSARSDRLETADELAEQLEQLKNNFDQSQADTLLRSARYTAGA